MKLFKDIADFPDLNSKMLKNCNYIRAILMLIIIINHSISIYSLANRGGWLPGVSAIGYIPAIFEWLGIWFATFMNYAFVIVSGYIYYAMRFEHGKYQNFGRFVQNKAQRLLLPMAFISFIWVIPISIAVLNFGINDVIYNFLLGVFPRQLWFILMLFWVFVIFAPLAKLADKNFFLGVLCVIVFLFIGKFGSKLTGGVNYYRIFDGFSYVIYFYVGFCLRKYSVKIFLKIPSVVYLLANILFIALNEILNTLSFPHLIDTALNIGKAVLLGLSGGLMAFVVLQKLLLRFNGENKVMNLFSKYSFTIFMIHEQFIYLAVVWYEGKVDSYIFPLLTLLWVVPASLGISYLLGKTKVTMFLIGMK